MRLALNDLYKPKWTDVIHEEWILAVMKRRPDLSREILDRTRDLMNAYVLEALVKDFGILIPRLNLPDPNDRHVLAAAIKSQANIIVTYNLQDFPEKELSPYNIEAQHPDTFVYQLLNFSMNGVLATMRQHREALKNPAKTPDEYLLTFEKQGLAQTVGTLRDFEYLI